MSKDPTTQVNLIYFCSHDLNPYHCFFVGKQGKGSLLGMLSKYLAPLILSFISGIAYSEIGFSKICFLLYKFT